MKLKVEMLTKYANRYALGDTDLANELGISPFLLIAAREDRRIGYDEVKDFYNENGEAMTVDFIDFEEETLNGFKAKYIQIGNRLF